MVEPLRRRIIIVVVSGLFLAWGPPAAAGEAVAPEDPRLTRARHHLVEEDVVAAGIRDARVCAALRDTPRHLFVPEHQRRFAYVDTALPIGSGQTISPPFIVARMTEQLDPQPDDKVLEIGTGSGYQAAVLSALVAEVYTIEIVESLGRTAAETLRRLDYPNVHTRIGDGFLGWPEVAPFDKIIVTCSPERVPEPLVEQLREGGRMVIPLGQRFQQTLCLLKKMDGKMQAVAWEPTYFVPMTGRADELRRKKDDSGIPELANGSFESSFGEGAPSGWYYARQASVVADPSAPDGQHVLSFRNETPGQDAQALQTVALDGRFVPRVVISLWIKTDHCRAGLTSEQVPHLQLVLFNEQRAMLGTEVLGPWLGSSTWTKKHLHVRVPREARLAGLAVGMSGATGQLFIDQLLVEALDVFTP